MIMTAISWLFKREWGERGDGEGNVVVFIEEESSRSFHRPSRKAIVFSGAVMCSMASSASSKRSCGWNAILLLRWLRFVGERGSHRLAERIAAGVHERHGSSRRR